MNSRGIFALGTAALLAACSTPSLVIDSSHPASIDAREASAKPLPNTLRADAASRRTSALLTEREQEAKSAEAEAPEDQTDLRPRTPSTPPPPEHHD